MSIKAGKVFEAMAAALQFQALQLQPQPQRFLLPNDNRTAEVNAADTCSCSQCYGSNSCPSRCACRRFILLGGSTPITGSYVHFD
jgi:hypothetical protein